MRWKCGCAYDGTDYFGWQTQDGQLSVQQVVEERLTDIFKQKTQVVGSGRTDAGVHAMEQVFHFDFDWKHDAKSLLEAMRSLFPETITPLYVERVDDSFHARFSAVSKLYQYRVCLGRASPIDTRYCWPLYGNLNIESMVEAMNRLSGTFDFGAFAANRGVEYETTVRTIVRAEILQDDKFLYLNFQADGFMYKMVRSLVGTIVNVGFGRLPLREVSKLLETAQRSPMVFVAPAKGLFMKKVYY